MTAVFETERTVVRPWREDEAGRLFDILRRDEVTQWFGTPRSLTDESEAAHRIRGWQEIRAADPRLGTWAIEEAPAAA